MHSGRQAAGSRKKISTKHSLRRVEQEVARGGGAEQERWEVDFSSTSPGTTLETRAGQSFFTRFKGSKTVLSSSRESGKSKSFKVKV